MKLLSTEKNSLKIRNLLVILTNFSIFLNGMAYAIPDWVKDQGQSLHGNTYRAICVGQGPSLDIARKEATQSCKASAIGLLRHEGQVHGLVIENNGEVALYQEIFESANYRGLTCSPEKESLEESTSGSYKIWLLCNFDLSKVQIGLDEVPPDSKNLSSNSSVKPSLSTLKNHSITKGYGNHIGRTYVVIRIYVVPGCTKIFVRGVKPRVIKCEEGISSLTIEDGDEEIIVTNLGYKSKSFRVKEYSWKNNDAVQVILESN